MSANDIYDTLKDLRDQYDLYEDDKAVWDALTEAMEVFRRFGGNWNLIVKDYEEKIGTWWLDRKGEWYKFYGIVYAEDDYYFGMLSDTGQTHLYSCCGGLENWFTPAPPFQPQRA